MGYNSRNGSVITEVRGAVAGCGRPRAVGPRRNLCVLRAPARRHLSEECV